MIDKILEEMERNISYKHWRNIEVNLEQLKKELEKIGVLNNGY